MSAQSIEDALLRSFLAAAGRAPLKTHGFIAPVLAGMLWCLPMRLGVLRENLALAFADPARGERPSRYAILLNACLFALELGFLRHGAPEKIVAAVSFTPETEANIQRARAGGRGFIMSAGHAGNWEWSAAWYQLRYGNFGCVYKPIHNPKIDATIRAIRERFGGRTFSTREKTPRNIFRFLREGGALGILSDQDARRKGRFFPFFGTPASTDPGLATLAIRQNIPVTFGVVLRLAPGRFLSEVAEPIWPDPNADFDAETERIMLQYHRWIEDATRRHPEQYFWWHRRWKSRPQ